MQEESQQVPFSTGGLAFGELDPSPRLGMLTRAPRVPAGSGVCANTYAHVTEDVEMRVVAQWKTFAAGWRIGIPGHEQIGPRS